MTINDFGDRLQAGAKRAGLSQAALATILDVAPSTVSEWFSGEYYPKAEILMVLPDILNCSYLWLMAGRGKIKAVQ